MIHKIVYKTTLGVLMNRWKIVLILLTVSVVANIYLGNIAADAKGQQDMWMENYRVVWTENVQLKRDVATLQQEIQRARSTNDWQSVFSLLGALLLP